MKTLSFFSLLLTAIMLMVSCEKEESNEIWIVAGTGEVVNKTLELDPFTQIELEGVTNLYVTVGGEQQVNLKAQQNIIDVMIWEVEAGMLTIRLKEGIKLQNHEEIRFDMVLPELESLFHNGVGDVTLEGAGSAVLDIQYQGIGQIDAYAFPVEHCTVITSGTGDCKVKVNHTLDVNISGIGNVYYKGNPEITSIDTGLGDLINDN